MSSSLAILTLPVQEKIRQLVPLCLEALPRMLVTQDELFCYREVWTDSGPKRIGSSVRYTAITLIGLAAAQRSGLQMPPGLETERLAARLSRELAAGLGDLGLILWALTTNLPDQAVTFCKTLLARLNNSDHALYRLDTMQLAWLLTGLCRAHQAGLASAALEKAIVHVGRVLGSAHEQATGLFYRFPAGRRSVIRWTASFAMEIYPVYALSLYAEVLGNHAAVMLAQACADKLCELQLADGGWPWMYDVRTGRLIDPYPVYSVHQDGMAPMALIKLSRVAGKDYSAAIDRGVAWLDSDNPMGVNMVDCERQTIWRAQEIPRLFGLQPRLLLNAGAALFLGRGLLSAGPLRLVAECRPYHLGWLLHAAFE